MYISIQNVPFKGLEINVINTQLYEFYLDFSSNCSNKRKL